MSFRRGDFVQGGFCPGFNETFVQHFCTSVHSKSNSDFDTVNYISDLKNPSTL